MNGSASITPTTLYVGTNGGGVFKSLNGGSSWSAISTGLAGIYINAVAVNPQTPTTLYAAGISGVSRSLNEGSSWSSINSGLTNAVYRTLAIDPQTPSTLYLGSFYGAGALDGRAFKSVTNGTAWGTFNTGLANLNVEAFAINPITPTITYAGTYGGVFVQQIVLTPLYLPLVVKN